MRADASASLPPPPRRCRARHLVLAGVALLLALQARLALNATLDFDHASRPVGAPAPGAARGAASVEPSPFLAEKAALIARPGLKLTNASTSAELLARAFGRRDILVTFGTSSLAPFVSNWVSALVRSGHTTLLVGALDDGLYEACLAAEVPAVRIDDPWRGGQRDGPEAGGEVLGGGYIRKDFAAFKRLGLRKAGRRTRPPAHLLIVGPAALPSGLHPAAPTAARPTHTGEFHRGAAARRATRPLGVRRRHGLVQPAATGPHRAAEPRRGRRAHLHRLPRPAGTIRTAAPPGRPGPHAHPRARLRPRPPRPTRAASAARRLTSTPA